MSEKTTYVKEPAESAIQIVCALIAAGKISGNTEEIVAAHQRITQALTKPRSQTVKL